MAPFARVIPRVEEPPSRYTSSRELFFVREREREFRGERTGRIIIVRSKPRAHGKRRAKEGEAKDVCALHISRIPNVARIIMREREREKENNRTAYTSCSSSNVPFSEYDLIN